VKVIVSGASGLIGSALVPSLRAVGHDVLTLVRRTPAASDEIAWDPAGGELDPAALAGADAIVNLSGATIGKRWSDARKAAILDSRVESTSLLARTAAALEPHPSVFVCAGGTGIYGNRDEEILTEDSELGSGFLADVGRAWEAAAQPARDAGIRVVNFRQGIVLSKDGGALERLILPFKLGLGGRVGSGSQWWAWVGLDDVAGAYRLALESDLAGPVNLVSPSPATNRQLVKALGRALHRPTVFPLPGFAVRTVFGEMGEELLLEGQRALPARLLDAGYTFAEPDLDAALERALAG
jgi:uncharacterized protein